MKSDLPLTSFSLGCKLEGVGVFLFKILELGEDGKELLVSFNSGH